MILHHTLTAEELEHMTPDALFVWLTYEIYDARTNNRPDTIAGLLSMLSIFSPDARRALCTGAAALRVMRGTNDTEYRAALMQALSETLYKEFNGRENK